MEGGNEDEEEGKERRGGRKTRRGEMKRFEQTEGEY